MEGWSSWEIWSLVIAAYVAVVSLVRLMLAHRDHLARDLEQIGAERRRLALEQLQAQRENRRREPAETRRAA